MHDREHPLLRFAREDLERPPDPRSRSGTASRSSSAPIPARAADSLTAHVMPAPPRSCRPSSSPPLDHLERGLDQQLLGERVADLHARAALGRIVLQGPAREHRHPRRSRRARSPRRTSTISEPACASRAEVTSRSARAIPTHITFTLGFEECAVGELHLAADGRDADAVAVAADAGHHAGEQPPVPLLGERAEPERDRAARSAGRPSPRCRARCRRRRSRRPGTARSRSGASATPS